MFGEYLFYVTLEMFVWASKSLPEEMAWKTIGQD